MEVVWERAYLCTRFRRRRGGGQRGRDGRRAQFFDKVGETRKENEREENRKEKMDGGARVKDNSKKRHIWSEDTHYHEEFDPGSG